MHLVTTARTGKDWMSSCWAPWLCSTVLSIGDKKSYDAVVTINSFPGRTPMFWRKEHMGTVAIHPANPKAALKQNSMCVLWKNIYTKQSARLHYPTCLWRLSSIWSHVRSMRSFPSTSHFVLNTTRENLARGVVLSEINAWDSKSTYSRIRRCNECVTKQKTRLSVSHCARLHFFMTTFFSNLTFHKSCTSAGQSFMKPH